MGLVRLQARSAVGGMDPDMAHLRSLRKVGYWRDNPDQIQRSLEHCRWFAAEQAQGNAMGADPDGGEAEYRREQAALPDVRTLVDPKWDPRERRAVVEYLEAGATHPVHARGWSTCRICGKANGSAEVHDGVYVWPEGFAHYVRDHAVKPPPEFVRHILVDPP